MKEQLYGFVDIETGGLKKDKHSVLTIALILVRENKILDKIEWKVRHAEYVTSAKALEINQIDLVAHDKEATPAIEVIDAFEKMVRKHIREEERLVFVGQNTTFDIGFLEVLFKQYGKSEVWKELISYRFVDLMSITALLSAAGQIEVESLSLDSVMEALDMSMGTSERHTAMADAMAVFVIWIHYQSLLLKTTTPL